MQSTYVELFTALREGLIATYGDTGCQHTFVVDFETAAINAMSSVFPDATVKGCSFHFRQAIVRRVQKEGLMAQYEDADDPVIRNWIRKIMSLTLLPPSVIQLAWDWLKIPPPTFQAEVDLKTTSLADYVERTWICGDFSPALWSHFNHNGPRTTNVAEGYHNGLNSRFWMPYPSLGVFLDWLQKSQFEVQCRGIQLARGRPSKRRLEKYVRLDAEI